MTLISIIDLKAAKPGRVAKLLACIVAIVVIWCLILPRLGELTPIRAHINAMQRGDVNVGAMFYSELNWEPPTGAAWR